MFSILAEYARTHDLMALLPRRRHINVFKPFDPRQVSFYPGVLRYDMLFNHHVFDPNILGLLHDDTFKFSILRNPETNFLSSFNYWGQLGGFKYLVNISGRGEAKLDNYMKNPAMYEPEKPMMSFTNNRQSLDLGFDVSRSFQDTEYVKQFVQNLEKTFDLFLIFEYFDEGLILLKRLLRWRTEDVLFFQKLKYTNLQRIQKKATHMSPDNLAMFRKIYTADITLYDHFLPIFRQRLAAQPGLEEEVKEFRTILDIVKQFCEDKVRPFNQLIIPPGRWTDQVVLLDDKCQWLQLDEEKFTQHLKRKQLNHFTNDSLETLRIPLLID